MLNVPKRWMSVLMVCLFVTGCRHKHSKSTLLVDTGVSELDNAYQNQLLTLRTELPEIPLGYMIDGKAERADVGFVITIVPKKSSYGNSSVMDSVVTEMDSLGWHLRHVLRSDKEMQYIFEKPSKKICIVHFSLQNHCVRYVLPQKKI
jgi:hypothetical protein